ncbi:hypothetical protein GH714_006916 [Hevea brasiliensis]|uniref:DRBM domain-containing protein n=1 Tax=Hevea brasiliensis TaxID=3981 RepID=A0A6A6LHM0_HEVBR|nr:hypothetical protein GH714_006916 [Hevea brasiliensis]
MHKTKLQELCQKRKWGLPECSAMKNGPDRDSSPLLIHLFPAIPPSKPKTPPLSTSEGPFHALHFKATVTIDGHTFESPEFFTMFKEAENAAAKTAIGDR